MATSASSARLEQLRKAIKDVLHRNYAKTHDAVKRKTVLNELAIKLLEAGIISDAIADEPDYRSVMGDFTAGFAFLKTDKEIETHCSKIIDALEELGGAARAVGESFREQFQTAAKRAGYENFLNPAAG